MTYDVLLPETAARAPAAPPTMSDLEYDLTLFPSPVLRKRAAEVTAFDADLGAMVRAMFDRMYKSSGVGLAAPQVGIKARVLVLNESGEPHDELVLINPELLERSGQPTKYEEGCLSFPEIFAEVERPNLCKVRAQDIEGNVFEAEYEGFQSRIVQHEFDHLEGVLLVDRMSPADKLKNKIALENLIEHYKRQVAKAAAKVGAKR